MINAREGARRLGSSPFCAGGKVHDSLPGVGSFPHLLRVVGGGEEVTSRAVVSRDGIIGNEKPLGVPSELELLQAPLVVARQLVGVFCAIVHTAMLPMFHTGQPSRLAALWPLN
jgi:hypothetical protein